MNKRWARHAIVLCVLLLGTGPAIAGDDARDAVLAAQAERIRAMVDADLDALGDLLSDDLVYHHTTGRVDTKAALIASLGPGGIDYQRIEPQDPTVRLYGNTAVVTGHAALKVIAAGQMHDLSILFTEVYVLSDRWRLVSWQSTRLPPPAPEN